MDPGPSHIPLEHRTPALTEASTCFLICDCPHCRFPLIVPLLAKTEGYYPTCQTVGKAVGRRCCQMSSQSKALGPGVRVRMRESRMFAQTFQRWDSCRR